jgi:hypothetical protein
MSVGPIVAIVVVVVVSVDESPATPALVEDTRTEKTKPAATSSAPSASRPHIAAAIIVPRSSTGGALTERLDEDKIDQLRRWGSGLANAEGDELRATGKAILLLIEEIEALHVDLWNAKSAAVDAPAGEDEEAEERDVHRTLAERLRFSRGRAGGEA